MDNELVSVQFSLNAVRFPLFPTRSLALVVSTTRSKSLDGRRSLKRYTRRVVRFSCRSGIVEERRFPNSLEVLRRLRQVRLPFDLLTRTRKDLTRCPRKWPRTTLRRLLNSSDKVRLTRRKLASMVLNCTVQMDILSISSWEMARISALMSTVDLSRIELDSALKSLTRLSLCLVLIRLALNSHRRVDTMISMTRTPWNLWSNCLR